MLSLATNLGVEHNQRSILDYNHIIVNYIRNNNNTVHASVQWPTATGLTDCASTETVLSIYLGLCTSDNNKLLNI